MMQGRYQDTKSSQSSGPWITADVERSRSFTRSIRQRQPEATMEDSSSRNPGPQVAKRVRKAINCQPCRHSKIKCDRDRPCSSCVLRGTASQCYQGVDLTEILESRPLDVTKQFETIRNSVSMLEEYFMHSQPRCNRTSTQIVKAESVDYGVPGILTKAPGMLGIQGDSGFYTGATSAASHLVMNGSPHHNPVNDRHSSTKRAYDNDLIDLLPKAEVLDGLIDYYFDYCNWIYRTVDRRSFSAAWHKFKHGLLPDRLILATVCILTALAIRYLPVGHMLLEQLPVMSKDEAAYLELSLYYYDVMKHALRRHRDEHKMYTLELVELLLAQSHYLTYAKTDPEDIWATRGELVTIGTAMGLHRDPGKSRFSEDAAERRRWAWWHIYLLESWQSFMFGRPMSIASDSFNTKFPSYCDSETDPSGRLYLPNIALFRLAFILGEIMEDAISFRPTSYESILKKDGLLTDWISSLPTDVDLDEYRIVRYLSSPVISVRRLGVQSIVLLSSYYHMRFTLHRPYAGALTTSSDSSQSLDIAVNAADRLISLATQTSQEFIVLDSGMAASPSHIIPHVHGHLNWRPFHVFSAAMFFTFQLIRSPEQPGANLFRSHVRKSLKILHSERLNHVSVAEKSLTVLLTLEPLYSEEFLALDRRGRERKKEDILSVVKTLDFPYQDPPRYSVRSPSAPFVYGEHLGNVDDSVLRSSMPISDMGHRAPHASGSAVSEQRPSYSCIPESFEQPAVYEYQPPGSSSSEDCGPCLDGWAGRVGFVKDEWLGFIEHTGHRR